MDMYACRRGHAHDFDYYSGWCSRGCGVRDDRRVMTRDGEVLSAGQYTDRHDFMASMHADELQAEHERRIADLVAR